MAMANYTTPTAIENSTTPTAIENSTTPTAIENSGEEAVLIICLLLLAVVVLIFLCCYKDRKLVHPAVKWRYYKQIFSSKPLETKRHSWLIKRCEQDNPGVRNVEDKIISKRKKLRKAAGWTQELDDGQTPVLVFCVNASRIGTDIESALRGVSNHRPVVLVVLHCKNPSSLRGDLSDDDYLLDQALRDRVTGIAHFAFSEFDGFYSCRQNKDGERILGDHLTKVKI